MTSNSNGTNVCLQNSSNKNHPTHGYQSLIKDQPAIQSAEITKFLKQNYTIPHDSQYTSEHLIRKTSRLRVPRTDPEQWRINFVRRKHQLSDGFFTPQHKPYRPIGNVELNPHQLVLEVFSDGLNKEVPLPPILTGKFPSKLSAQPDLTESHKKVMTETHKSHSGGGLDFTSADINTAGFTFIEENLNDSKQMLIANRGGQTYDKCIKNIEILKKEKSQEVDQNSVWTLQRPRAPSQCDKGMMIPVLEIPSAAISSAHDPSTLCSKAAANEEDLEVERERMIYNRRRRALVKRLQAVQMIINALHNMRARDLRSRVPLTLEMVKMLYRDVAAEKPSAFNRQLLQAVQNESNEMISSGEAKGQLGKNLSKASIPQKDLERQGEELMSTTPRQWRKFRQTIPQPKRELRVETWEDFICLSSPPGGHHRSSMFPSTGCGGFGTHQSRWLTPTVLGSTQKLPLWQMVGLAAEDTMKRSIPTHNSKSNKHQHDPENTLKSIRENFIRVKRKMAREVQSDLERLFRDRTRTFRQKFHVITQSSLFEKTIQNLKEVSTSQPVLVITNHENREIKPSKWFIDLKSQAENTVGKDDLEVNKSLQQLSRFSLEDAKSIPNAKEKLCLLMLSMPPSQLLTIQVQEALKFVLEEILWAPSECFQEWLHHRRIPVVLYSPSLLSV